jgi:hypothetical protein
VARFRWLPAGTPRNLLTRLAVGYRRQAGSDRTLTTRCCSTFYLRRTRSGGDRRLLQKISLAEAGEEVGFALDSLLEEAGFEPSVPRGGDGCRVPGPTAPGAGCSSMQEAPRTARSRC